ncbi:hypothetical protein HK405_000999, partial [Cladochytrium tenue]
RNTGAGRAGGGKRAGLCSLGPAALWPGQGDCALEPQPDLAGADAILLLLRAARRAGRAGGVRVGPRRRRAPRRHRPMHPRLHGAGAVARRRPSRCRRVTFSHARRVRGGFCHRRGARQAATSRPRKRDECSAAAAAATAAAGFERRLWCRRRWRPSEPL